MRDRRVRAVGGCTGASGAWDDVVSTRRIMVERWTEQERERATTLDRMLVDDVPGAAPPSEPTALDGARVQLERVVRCVAQPRGRVWHRSSDMALNPTASPAQRHAPFGPDQHWL